MYVFYFTRKQDNFFKTKFKIIGRVLDLTLGKAFSMNLIASFATCGRFFYKNGLFSSGYDYIALSISNDNLVYTMDL